MLVNKGLLLKGLGVCALCAGGTALFLKREDIKSAFSSSDSRKKRIAWGGLECDEPTAQEGGECELKTGEGVGKILVKKKAGSSFELSNLEGGKIKVYKVEKTEGDDGYKDGFKFLVEEGDIGTGDNKLEEFETYEIKKGTETDGAELKDQYFLSQKTDSKTEIKNALGLPWDLPSSAPEDHANITNDDLKKIKFSGKTSPATISEGSITLTISKETDKAQYPLGYKFTFKNAGEGNATLTIGDEAIIKIKKDSPINYDFKIKQDGFFLSLEKAWSIEGPAKKVGLVKESEGDFWDVGPEGLNIKVNTSTKKTKKTKKDGTQGKIKVYEGQSEYNGGFKFTIENGDLNLNDSGSDITLEEFQSYEIVKESDNNWYLFKKDEGQERIKELLGIKCEVPAGQTDCSLTAQNVKNIRFKGGKATLSGGTVTLTISKDSSKEEYPLGFKFSFKNTAGDDATLTIGSETITLKQNSPVEFKIKKEESSLSLEKAWTLEELTKKVGLVKESTGDFWNVESSGLNIKQEAAQHTKKTKKSGTSGKIKVYEGQAGYNEGFKFTIENSDLNLNGEKTSDSIVLGQFQNYEIVKDGGNWYFSRKDEGQSEIKRMLGFGCEFPTSETSSKCDLTNDNIGTIKFEGAGSATATITGNPKLTIQKESARLDYPLGFKFVFSAESGSTITIPSSSTPLTIKEGLSVDYKIKSTGDNEGVLTLEKAWTADSLMDLVSFKKNGNDWWEVGDGVMNIKQGNNKSTNVSKSTGSQSAKIRVYEGSPGYYQGMKFVVEEGNTTMDGSDGISQITKYESYEVATYEGQWYFTRKLNTSDSIREILGLPSTCSMPTDQDASKTCELDSAKLKEVKFKDADSVTVTGGSSVTLKITKESSSSNLPLGYKFTFNSNNEFKIKESGGKSTLEKV